VATFRDIKKVFFQMDEKNQEQILREIYNFSKETKAFLNMNLLGSGDKIFIDEISKASESSTPKGYPKEISVRKINSILSKAKKSKVNNKTLQQMELIAFEGYMTFLNDYGGGPEIYEDKIGDHLKNYLLLVLKNEPYNKHTYIFDEMRGYLRANQNMLYDNIWHIFENLTGEEV